MRRRWPRWSEARSWTRKGKAVLGRAQTWALNPWISSLVRISFTASARLRKSTFSPVKSGGIWAEHTAIPVSSNPSFVLVLEKEEGSANGEVPAEDAVGSGGVAGGRGGGVDLLVEDDAAGAPRLQPHQRLHAAPPARVGLGGGQRRQRQHRSPVLRPPLFIALQGTERWL